MRISPKAAQPVETAAPAQWFSGDAWIETHAAPAAGSRTQIDSVRFAPGARTVWHRHPLGQILIVTEGTGLVQLRGEPARVIRTGDTVHVAAGEWHWHGATPDAAMTHLAVEELPEDGAVTEAGAPVTGDEYEACETPAHAAEEPPPVSRTVVLDQLLPNPHETHRLEIRRITIAPGHAAGLHVHNGPVFGSVETGSAVYQVEGGPASILGPGDVFYEPQDVRIARFDARAEGVTFLGYFLLAEDQAAEIAFPTASPHAAP